MNTLRNAGLASRPLARTRRVHPARRAIESHARLVGVAVVLVATACLSPATQAQEDPPPGLVAWWPADGTAIDIVGGHDGTLVGPVSYGPGVFGQAFNFVAGDDDRVEVPTAPELEFGETKPLTIAFWLGTQDLSGSHLIGKRDGCGGEPFTFQANHWFFDHLGFGSPFGGVESDIAIPYPAWTHVVFTFDYDPDTATGVAKLFMNGVDHGSNTGLLGPAISAPFTIGGSGGCPSWTGQVDEVQIFDRALTPAEIQDLFDPGEDPPLFGASTSYGAGFKPSSVAVTDVSGDGQRDLVVANADSDTVSVRLGQGGGVLGIATDYPTGSKPTSVAVADVSDDDQRDLAVVNFGSDTVSVRLNQGGGMFGAPTNYPAGQEPSFVALGDVSGDGRRDLVVAISATNRVSVRLNQGGGVFGPATNYVVGMAPSCVALLQSDDEGGLVDLVVTNADSNTISVLPALGGGLFGVPTSYAVGSSPRSVAAGDVDGDGLLDLAVANSGFGANSISVLLGQSGGLFAAATPYGVGSRPVSVAEGDLDGDNHRDLVVACSGSSTISVLLGLGDGTFAAPIDTAVGTAPSDVALGDMDGDGRADMATADEGSNTVTVVLNDSPWAFLGSGLPGVSGVPSLVGTGTLEADSPGALDLSNAKPSTACLLFVSLASTPASFKGGTLVPVPELLLVSLSTLPTGTLPLPFTWPAGVPSNTSIWLQYAINDAAAVKGVALSNAVKATTP